MDRPRRRRSTAGLARQAALEHDRLLLAVIRETYRNLERAYRSSEQYARMVREHPELARAIDRSELAKAFRDCSAGPFPTPGLEAPST
ncbi:MAG: hypothetical protein RLZZ124_1697 [Cyanobacteriota bacterium]